VIFGFQDKNGRYLWVGWGYMTCLASVPNHAPPGQAYLIFNSYKTMDLRYS
jgi:hypothetical protein